MLCPTRSTRSTSCAPPHSRPYTTPYPPQLGFHGHGLYISNATDRLYVVNHANAYSGVEIFNIEYPSKCAGPGDIDACGITGSTGGEKACTAAPFILGCKWVGSTCTGGSGNSQPPTEPVDACTNMRDETSCASAPVMFKCKWDGTAGALPTLQHEGTIGGDGVTFPLRAINDVVEGGAGLDEIYVTQWLPYAIPLEGKKKQGKSLGEIGAELGNVGVGLFGIKATDVHRCARGTAMDIDFQIGREQVERMEAWACAVATKATRFVGANGITISTDRQTVFVNDPASKEITVLSRDPSDGALDRGIERFSTEDAMDNIEWVDDEDKGDDGSRIALIMGSIPALSITVLNDLTGSTTPNPGGAVMARRDDTGRWRMDKLVTHDGKKLSQISAAARWGSRVVMGSPFSDGMLVCDDIEEKGGGGSV